MYKWTSLGKSATFINIYCFQIFSLLISYLFIALFSWHIDFSKSVPNLDHKRKITAKCMDSIPLAKNWLCAHISNAWWLVAWQRERLLWSHMGGVIVKWTLYNPWTPVDWNQMQEVFFFPASITMVPLRKQWQTTEHSYCPVNHRHSKSKLEGIGTSFRTCNLFNNW